MGKEELRTDIKVIQEHHFASESWIVLEIKGIQVEVFAELADSLDPDAYIQLSWRILSEEERNEICSMG